MTEQREGRPLSDIAKDILANWERPSPYALPYIQAMKEMTVPGQDYLLDSEKSVILYFLANASTWRGTYAREIKDELKKITK